MQIVNDNNCSWISDLYIRSKIKVIETNKTCDWLIVGAGYTGLSAARKLSALEPDKKIIIVDAQLAGEGASSRNSGYLVDSTLNDGFTSNKELGNYKKKTQKMLKEIIAAQPRTIAVLVGGGGIASTVLATLKTRSARSLKSRWISCSLTRRSRCAHGQSGATWDGAAMRGPRVATRAGTWGAVG